MTLLGQAVIAFVIFFIHTAVLIELFPVYYLLEELGPYENKFNYISGWPLYVFTMIYYCLCCIQGSGIVQGGKGWCQLCNQGRSARTSHCKTCNVCIIRRDHHCIFTNQCIGLGNMKLFQLFVFWATLGIGHYLIRQTQFWYYRLFLEMPSNSSIYQWGYVYSIAFIWHFILGIALWLFVFLILLSTSMNLSTNRVSMDKYRSKHQMQIPCVEEIQPLNSYSIGLIPSFLIVFGNHPLKWFLPFIDLENQKGDEKQVPVFDTRDTWRLGRPPGCAREMIKHMIK